MKAIFTGLDYLVYINRSSDEFHKLKDSKLSATLKRLHGNDLGTLVTLELAENNSVDGIKSVFTPASVKDNKEYERIEIKINNMIYQRLHTSNEVVTCYGFTSNKLFIYHKPLFEQI